MTSSTYSIILVIFIVIVVYMKCMNRWDEAYCIQTFAVIVGQCVQIVYIAWILFVVPFQHQTWQWIHVFDVHFYAFLCALKLWFLPRKIRGNGMCVVVTNTDSPISNSRENKYATKKSTAKIIQFPIHVTINHATLFLSASRLTSNYWDSYEKHSANQFSLSTIYFGYVLNRFSRGSTWQLIWRYFITSNLSQPDR